jgi:hypothetical protein
MNFFQILIRVSSLIHLEVFSHDSTQTNPKALRGFEPQGPNISPKAFEAATDLSFLKRLEQHILGMGG